MSIDASTIGTILSIVSLILAVVFWWLASKQAEKSDRVLNEIKDQIMSWQSKMNSAAINLIEARPEVIAQKVALAESPSSIRATIEQRPITMVIAATQNSSLLSIPACTFAPRRFSNTTSGRPSILVHIPLTKTGSSPLRGRTVKPLRGSPAAAASVN
ncbi:MAG: hypothetical protein V7742_22520 [Halioglobus sp.]